LIIYFSDYSFRLPNHIATVTRMGTTRTTHPEKPEADYWRVEPETAQLRRLQTGMAEAELALARRLQVNPTDLAAMGHLAGASDPVGPTWLSGRLGLTPAAATELVDRLERAGHVERRRDTVDRRRVQLVPTRSALAEVGEQLSPLLQALDRVVTGYPPAQRQIILDYLGQVSAAYANFGAESEAPA
jgi:DNA-binding MarR family transcriptional regulator